MTATRLIIRFLIGPVTIIAVGVAALFGMQVLEPFAAAVSVPVGLDWGTPIKTMLRFFSFGVAGCLLVLMLWMIYAPVRTDVRQEFG